VDFHINYIVECPRQITRGFYFGDLGDHNRRHIRYFFKKCRRYDLRALTTQQKQNSGSCKRKSWTAWVFFRNHSICFSGCLHYNCI